MIGYRSISSLSPWKVTNEFNNPAPEVKRQTENRAQLNNDGEHLPEGVIQMQTQSLLGDTQMRRRTDGKKFGETFNDAKQDRQQVVVQISSASKVYSSAALDS